MMSGDYKSKIYRLFPEHLSSNKDFMAFVEVIASEYSTMAELLEAFPNLTQIDNVPETFFNYLTYLFDYRVLDSEDLEVQREVVKRILGAISQRGSETSMIKSASRANDDNWYREDLTYYRGDLEEEVVSLTYPQYHLFTWNKSEWSLRDKFPDQDYWTDGVIIFNMSNITQATREAIERVIPAGRRYYFVDTIWIVSDDIHSELGLLRYTYKLWDYQDIIYFMRVRRGSSADNLSEDFTWGDSSQYSGHQVLYKGIDIKRFSGASALPYSIELLNPNSIFSRLEEGMSIYDGKVIHDLSGLQLIDNEGFKIRENYRGVKGLSEDFVWDGKYNYSGISTGVIDSMVRIQPVLPNDRLYDFEQIQNLKYLEYRDLFEISDF